MGIIRRGAKYLDTIGDIDLDDLSIFPAPLTHSVQSLRTDTRAHFSPYREIISSDVIESLPEVSREKIGLLILKLTQNYQRDLIQMAERGIDTTSAPTFDQVQRCLGELPPELFFELDRFRNQPLLVPVPPALSTTQLYEMFWPSIMKDRKKIEGCRFGPLPLIDPDWEKVYTPKQWSVGLTVHCFNPENELEIHGDNAQRFICYKLAYRDRGFEVMPAWAFLPFASRWSNTLEEDFATARPIAFSDGSLRLCGRFEKYNYYIASPYEELIFSNYVRLIKYPQKRHSAGLPIMCLPWYNLAL